MVVDEYDRDYYFNGNNVVQVNDTRTTSAIQILKQALIQTIIWVIQVDTFT